MSAYPLATVLALRARAVDRARVDLARAREALDRRRRELELHAAAAAAHAQRAADAARRLAAAGGGGEREELALRARWAGRLRDELGGLLAARAAAERAAAAAEREAEARRDALAAARGGLRALEVHRDGWRAAQARRRDRVEQDAADDLVSASRAGR